MQAIIVTQDLQIHKHPFQLHWHQHSCTKDTIKNQNTQYIQMVKSLNHYHNQLNPMT